MKEEIFEREIKMCQELSKKRESCNWGKCKDCGVIPLLYKLHKGELVEDKKEIKELKGKYLRNEQKRTD